MDRRDYILRMIERFGHFAVAVRDMILGRADADQVREQLRTVAGYAGLDLELARVVALETLVGMAAPGGEVEPGRCWMYAEVLYLDGLAAETTGELDRAWSSYHKARALFELVAPHGGLLVGLPEAGDRIVEIDRRLETLTDPDGGPGDRRIA